MRIIAEYLDEWHISPAESALFGKLSYGALFTPTELPHCAAGDYYSWAGPTTVEECQIALDACLSKGWLQVVDETALVAMTAELRASGTSDPIDGYPLVGRVDFTRAGAAIKLDLCDRLRREILSPVSVYGRAVRSTTATYCRSRQAALECWPEEMPHGTVMHGPEPIGPWRARWWQRFDEGYRVLTEDREYASMGSWNCHHHRPENVDSQRLREVLSLHNVTPEQWVAIAKHESGPLHSPAYKNYPTHGHDLALTLTAAEYLAAVNECLQLGWLRVLDQQSIHAVQKLLRDDTAHLAVPNLAMLEPTDCSGTGDLSQLEHPAFHSILDRNCLGQIDFTTGGAQLYRTIMGEWLGPDWEDNLVVTNTLNWEEHHYSVSAVPFAQVAFDHAFAGHIIRGCRLKPIGPWCIHWWDRQPAGFRLELDLAYM